ncbi:hypothetical protein BU26DRAFT_511428 [Trematosphaeria pertusa]|uniref:Uncharacterized protein n=1 Tax=Trematosphaeria pertusa TaxID=390896 RepID=A0A6A6HT00_9PLEO|nr:uncharacterized protein BU26DRAFT_511428 [Trematosphaeria pertusa]KAF2241314.1 hypothetical protein BU26DRAFT_511428 [Trematosphaeria pertusa]
MLAPRTEQRRRRRQQQHRRSAGTQTFGLALHNRPTAIGAAVALLDRDEANSGRNPRGWEEPPPPPSTPQQVWRRAPAASGSRPRLCFSVWSYRRVRRSEGRFSVRSRCCRVTQRADVRAGNALGQMLAEVGVWQIVSVAQVAVADVVEDRVPVDGLSSALRGMACGGSTLQLRKLWRSGGCLRGDFGAQVLARWLHGNPRGCGEAPTARLSAGGASAAAVGIAAPVVLLRQSLL